MGLRSLLICVIVITLALTGIVMPTMAQPDMSIPFITTPWFVAARPAHLAALTIIETNTSHLAASDSEAFALSFLPTDNPESGGFTFAPTIAQTSSGTIAADRTYTFRDFLTI